MPQDGEDGWLKVEVLHSTRSTAYGPHVFDGVLRPTTVRTVSLPRDFVLISEENKPDRVGEIIFAMKV